jgi:hypothetical protein
MTPSVGARTLPTPPTGSFRRRPESILRCSHLHRQPRDLVLDPGLRRGDSVREWKLIPASSNPAYPHPVHHTGGARDERTVLDIEGHGSRPMAGRCRGQPADCSGPVLVTGVWREAAAHAPSWHRSHSDLDRTGAATAVLFADYPRWLVAAPVPARLTQTPKRQRCRTIWCISRSARPVSVPQARRIG